MVHPGENLTPPEELLSRVRFISQYFTEIDAETRKRWIDRMEFPFVNTGIRDELLRDLEISAGAIRVSSRVLSKGLFQRKRRVIYQVTEEQPEGSKVRLEFIDVVGRGGTGISQELETVQRCELGDWIQKIESVYQKCLDIRNRREQIPPLERRLQEIENAEEIIKLIEEAKEPPKTINLLLLSQNYDFNVTILFWAYLTTGRVSDVVSIVREAARLHPKDAPVHLILGNLYWTALRNEVGWAPGSDVGPLEQLTLEVMGCNYGIAAGSAESLYEDAIRLAKDDKTRKHALEQLKSLKLMDEVYGRAGEKR